MTALNLAVTLALAGKSTVLVDADFRHPSVHHAFDIDNWVGLSSVLLGSHQWPNALRAIDSRVFEPTARRSIEKRDRNDSDPLRHNLACISSGPFLPVAQEVAALKRMEALIDELRAVANYVVISVGSRPLASAADIAHMTDMTLLVVPLRQTRIGDIRKALQALKGRGSRNLEAIVTGAR